MYLLRFNRKVEEEEQRQQNELWKFGELEAHIANCLAPREDKQPWKREHFITLKGDKKEVKKERLTLKQAKQALGSKFNLN